MKLILISDTHEKHEQLILPEGDMLVHCGDFTNKGSVPSIGKFLTWFSSQPHKYKCFIMGNHELGTEMGPMRDTKLSLVKDFCNRYNNLHYLEHNSINIEGLHIFGSPYQPWFHSWAWNVPRGPEIAKKWSQIPDSTNVLITHGPPKGILDLVEGRMTEDLSHEGCQDLLDRIDQLKQLKAHVFGHLHYNGGMTSKINDVIFANAAICDDYHNPTRKPLIIEI